jgi:excinuclease ABC subunit C
MFKEKLANTPELPGSYQMKDADGVIIYVGKAKNLKKRLSSYFNGRVTGKTKVLVSNIHDFEYIVTSSELESLILEITLIKKYNPKYNVLLKDDKSYPYIEFTNDKYPLLKIIRNPKLKKNKNNLYGPFPNVGSAKRTVNMLNRIYPLRKCEKLKKDVCLYYHLGECLGYCKMEVDNKKLEEMVHEIKAFLNGDSSFIVKRLNEKMNDASNSLNFEKALEYKRMIDDINITLKNQIIVLNKDYNFDLFNCYQNNNYLSITAFFIRGGTLFGREKKIINTLQDSSDALLEYIIKFYDKNILPKQIFVPEIIDQNLLSNYLNIKVETREKGDIKKLLDLAYSNSKIYLEEKENELNQNEEKRLEALDELKKLLNVDKVSRMESFDNSHLFGTYYVGGMVVYEDFLPKRDEYRKFKVDVSTKDDLTAMREVVYRRYYRLFMENGKLPDLIVVDGGELQVKTVVDIINELNLPINVIGLKKDSHHKTNTIIDRNLNEIKIDSHSNLFLYLANIQEEVHRFAITYHRNIKNKGMLASVLEMVPGIGEGRRKQLLKEFSSLKKIKEASISDLDKVLPHDVSINLYNYLKENE